MKWLRLALILVALVALVSFSFAACEDDDDDNNDDENNNDDDDDATDDDATDDDDDDDDDDEDSRGVSNHGTGDDAPSAGSGQADDDDDDGEDSYGVYNYYGTVTMTNNTINGGSGSESVGVSNYDGTATLALANNTIDGGSGDSSYGVCNYSYGTATLVNNDIWGVDVDCLIYDGDSQECDANTIGEVNACEWYGCGEASGNISDDPLFVKPTGGDFHLQSTSPCRDTGIDPVPNYIDPGFVEFDFEGDARPYGSRWDIGVDEWTP